MTIYEKLKPYLKDYLRDMHGISDLNKPFHCVNPEHPDNNPSMSFDAEKNIIHCFGCGKTYDLVSLATMDFGNKEDAIEVLKNKYLSGNGKEATENAHLSPKNEKPDNFTYPTDKAPAIDYLAHKRGFRKAEKIADLFHLASDGKAIYFPHRLSEKIGGMDERESWQSRAINEASHGERYRRAKGSPSTFYSPCLSLYMKTPQRKKLFVFFEGEIDYLSFEDMRLNGDLETKEKTTLIPVATSSASNVTADKNGLFNSFLDELEEENKAGLFGYGFILAFDDDPSGWKARDTAKAVLKSRGYKCCSKPIYCQGCKDLNESMMKDRQATAKALKELETGFEQEAQREETKSQEEYIKAHSARSELEALFASLEEVSINPVKTHYKGLDTALEGEITGGSVVTIGAMSSVGKTTFLLQMAEQIAIEEKRDVLYFNLEQSTRDLIAKSISRLTFLEDTKGKIAVEDSEKAKTAVGISQGRRYRLYSQDEKELIEKGKAIYARYVDRLYFVSPSVDEIGFSGADIAQKVKEHIEATGHKPVVMVDYLQIMKPISKGQSDKEAVEQNFLALKGLASKYGLVVFLLCSVNRGSYGGFVEMDSLKESGMIEYSSDYLLGLNYEESRQVKKPKETMKKTEEDRQADEKLKTAKSKPIADIVVSVLKNRNGKIGDEVKFKYYKLFNLFVCNGLRRDAERIFLEDSDKADIAEDEDLPF